MPEGYDGKLIALVVLGINELRISPFFVVDPGDQERKDED